MAKQKKQTFSKGEASQKLLFVYKLLCLICHFKQIATLAKHLQFTRSRPLRHTDVNPYFTFGWEIEGKEEKRGKKRKIGNRMPGDEGREGSGWWQKLWEWRKKKQKNGKKQAPFRVNGIQKPSPIIFPSHASETDLIKMAWEGSGERGRKCEWLRGQAGDVSAAKHKAEAARMAVDHSAFSIPDFKEE